MIQFIAEQVTMPSIEISAMKAWIKWVAATYQFKCGDIAFVFCNDARILQLNIDYLQHDYYTDVITFDYSTNTHIAGDVFISLDTVRSNAIDAGIDFTPELHRIIIHAILHLCGNDDKTPDLRAQMTEKENSALAIFEENFKS